MTKNYCFIRTVVLVTACALSSLLFSSVVFAGDVALVANDAVAEASLNQKDVKKIFLGKKTRWENGDKIIIVTLDDGVSHEQFVKDFVGKTPSQYKKYWKKLTFTGKGKAPKSFKSEDELAAYVAETAGAIGYLAPATASDKTKIIDVK